MYWNFILFKEYKIKKNNFKNKLILTAKDYCFYENELFIQGFCNFLKQIDFDQLVLLFQNDNLFWNNKKIDMRDIIMNDNLQSNFDIIKIKKQILRKQYSKIFTNKIIFNSVQKKIFDKIENDESLIKINFLILDMNLYNNSKIDHVLNYINIITYNYIFNNSCDDNIFYQIKNMLKYNYYPKKIIFNISKYNSILDYSILQILDKNVFYNNIPISKIFIIMNKKPNFKDIENLKYDIYNIN